MTRYSALKQPPLSTAQGGSTSPFSIFRPSQNSPAPLKKRPSPKENARHPIGGKSGQQGFNKRESLGRGKGGVWGGEPFWRRVPLPLPKPLPFPSQDFRLVGRRRAGSPFRLGFEKFLCAVQKRDIPVTSITPSSVCFGGSRGGSPLPARLALCGVQRQRFCRSSRGGAPGGFILLLEIVP